MKKQLINLSLFLFLVVTLTGCCSYCGPTSTKITDLEMGSWRVIEINQTAIEDSQITLTFDPEEKVVYGTAPCNNFFASYTLFKAKGTERNIEFKNGGGTMRLCPDTELEEAVTRALPTVSRVKLEGENLLLIDSSEELVAVLVKIKQ